MMKIRYIPFHSDEWLTGTAGLDNAERGMYITACALIYSHGGPIPEVELRRACRDHGHAYKRQLGCLISTGKLLLHDGQIDNKRCANELQTLRKRSTNGRQNSSKRWKNNKIDADPAMLRGNANQEPIGCITKPSSREGFVILARARDATPLAVANGDGAALRAPVEPEAATEHTPADKAYVDEAVKHVMAALHGKQFAFDGDGAVAPPDPAALQFRQRLVKLNTLAGERLNGDIRTAAWERIAEAESLGPDAIPPPLAAALAAIEGLEYAEAAE